MNKKELYFAAALAVSIVGSFLAGTRHGRQRAWDNIEERTDTVVKVVPVYKDFPQPVNTASYGFVSVPSYRFLTDTLTNDTPVFLHDTTVVYLPREQKYYNEADGKLRLWISGYDPSLDRYELDLPTTTITSTVKEKPRHWHLGVTGGYGATLQGNEVLLSPYIGIGLTYSIVSF